MLKMKFYQEKTDAVEAPLVDLSETKPEETPAEVSTPTAVKELAPVLSEAPAEAAVQPKKEQEEKGQETEKTTATETKEEESKATNWLNTFCNQFYLMSVFNSFQAEVTIYLIVGVD